MKDLEKIDQNDMTSMSAAFPVMLRATSPTAEVLGKASEVMKKGIHGICLLGMGGSAIAGEMCKGLLSDRTQIPIVTTRDYVVPKYVDQKWTAIAVSYSGNTEETIAAFQEVIDRGVSTFVLTTGGLLGTQASKPRSVILPGGFQPRAALPIIFSALLPLVETLLGQEPTNLEEISTELERLPEDWESSGYAPEGLSSALQEKTPLFIGWRHLAAVAYRAKCQINENSKRLAMSSVLPEMNHNEIEGVGSCGKMPLLPVFLRSQEEDMKAKKRIEATSDIFSKGGCPSISLNLGLKSRLLEMLGMTMYLDLVSVELARILGEDPVSVDRISELKHRLGG